MSLESEIAAWDNKSASDIRSIYERYAHEASFLSEIIDLMAKEPLQRGATWLLKHYFDTGGQLEPRLAARVYGWAAGMAHWEARLHVLQCMTHMAIRQADAKAVEAFIRTALSDDVKFVRAWAYSGFHELATQHPSYRTEATRLFEKALKSETAGSAKARLRRIVKQGF